MIALARMDRGDDPALLMLHRLAVAEHRDASLRMNARIERDQGRGAEQNDEKKECNGGPGNDFAPWIAGPNLSFRSVAAQVGHAPAPEACGLASRATTSRAGPIIFGRPAS